MKSSTIVLIAAIVAAAMFGLAARAADITVQPNAVPIPNAAVSDVVAWLDTQPDLYTTTVVTETRTDPETGEEFEHTRTVKVKVPETAREKLLRIIDAQTRAHIRQGVRQVRQAREEAKAAAAVEAAPDPISE